MVKCFSQTSVVVLGSVFSVIVGVLQASDSISVSLADNPPIADLPITRVLNPPEGTEATQEKAHEVPAVPDPTFLLIQDPVIQRELGLTKHQRQLVNGLLKEHNQLLLAIRDVGPQGAPPDVKLMLQQIRHQILHHLEDTQRELFAGLVLQAQSYDALRSPELVGKLKLSSAQSQRLEEIGADFRRLFRQWNESANQISAEKQEETLNKLRVERHQAVLAALNEKQKQLWSKLLGPPFDLSKVHSSPAWAPEFSDVELWLNSEPLTMQELQGKVGIVHFFAFGCINCIHNYPWYREWYEQLPADQVTIVGIHTPETNAEHNVADLKSKLADNDLKFPVAVDNKKQNWQAWSNNVWPSVYLVDKQGRVRYWWYGELDWQRAGGQKLMRQRIDQLLAESSEVLSDE